MKHVSRWSRCWLSRGCRESKKVAILSVLTTHMCSPGLCPCFFSCSTFSLSNIPYSAWLLKSTSQPLASLLNSRYGLPAALLATSSWLRCWHLLYGMNHTYYLLPNPFLWCHFFSSGQKSNEPSQLINSTFPVYFLFSIPTSNTFV